MKGCVVDAEGLSNDYEILFFSYIKICFHLVYVAGRMWEKDMMIITVTVVKEVKKKVTDWRRRSVRKVYMHT